MKQGFKALMIFSCTIGNLFGRAAEAQRHGQGEEQSRAIEALTALIVLCNR